MNQTSSDPYTLLNDRVLWNDGESSYFVEALRDKILDGDNNWAELFVIDEDDISVKEYNLRNPEKTLKEKTHLNFDDKNLEWNVPKEYLNIDLKKLLTGLLRREFRENDFTTEQKVERVERVKQELILWEEFEKLDLLRTLVYIVHTFKRNNVVWGTGRGSSCCSYVLYLIDLHDVDSIEYDLDIRDFFRG